MLLNLFYMRLIFMLELCPPELDLRYLGNEYKAGKLIFQRPHIKKINPLILQLLHVEKVLKSPPYNSNQYKLNESKQHSDVKMIIPLFLTVHLSLFHRLSLS